MLEALCTFLHNLKTKPQIKCHSVALAGIKNTSGSIDIRLNSVCDNDDNLRIRQPQSDISITRC